MRIPVWSMAFFPYCSSSLLSEADASPAVHGDDLAGDVGRVRQQELYRPRDVVGLADAFQRGLVDDALARDFIAPGLVVGPEYGAGRDPVHPDFGAEVARERA